MADVKNYRVFLNVFPKNYNHEMKISGMRTKSVLENMFKKSS